MPRHRPELPSVRLRAVKLGSSRPTPNCSFRCFAVISVQKMAVSLDDWSVSRYLGPHQARLIELLCVKILTRTGIGEVAKVNLTTEE